MTDEKKTTKEDAVAKLQTELAVAKGKVKELTKSLADASKEAAELGAKLAKANDRIRIANDELAEATERRRVAEQKAAAMEGDLAAAKKTIADLEAPREARGGDGRPPVEALGAITDAVARANPDAKAPEKPTTLRPGAKEESDG